LFNKTHEQLLLFILVTVLPKIILSMDVPQLWYMGFCYLNVPFVRYLQWKCKYMYSLNLFISFQLAGYRSGVQTVRSSVIVLVVVLNNVTLYGAVFVHLDGREITVIRTLTNARI